MDDQIARMMFDTISREVIEHIKNSSSDEDLTERLKSKLTYFDSVSSRKENSTLITEVYFFEDKSKKDKIRVFVSCEEKEKGILVQGSVEVGKVSYTSYPHLYD